MPPVNLRAQVFKKMKGAFIPEGKPAGKPTNHLDQKAGAIIADLGQQKTQVHHHQLLNDLTILPLR